MKRSGFADLPLHGGHVPSWLATRMTTLGTAISESILQFTRAIEANLFTPKRTSTPSSPTSTPSRPRLTAASPSISHGRSILADSYGCS